MPRDHQPKYRVSTQRVSGYRSATNNVPRLFSELFGNIVHSQVENRLVVALPSHIIEGYCLAKAVRIVHVILPIVHKLTDLGVTLDIHSVIRTYHLKTCVFCLPQHYVFDELEIEGNNRLKWAIAIFEKLREYVVLGNAKDSLQRIVMYSEGLSIVINQNANIVRSYSKHQYHGFSAAVVEKPAS